MRRHKRGSLSLSINAIVVLILAITMLGLSLGFIKMMFGKVTNLVDAQISSEPEPVPPDLTNPITLSRGTVVGNRGETVVVKIAVFCNQANCKDASTAPTAAVACTGLTPTNPTFPVGIPQYKTATGVSTIVLGSTAATTVCTVTTAAGHIDANAKVASFALITK